MIALRRGLVAALVIAACSLTAHAGNISNWTAMWIDNSALDMNQTSWSWMEPVWTIDEYYVDSQLDEVIMQCGGTTDADPTITITKSIENDSSVDWTGFDLVIAGTNASYVAGSINVTSGQFATISEVGGNVSLSGGTVTDGDTLDLSFDVLIPPSVNFTLDVTQTPVPEPASMSLLALGGLAALRRRRS
jgi:hypothetical protein